MRTTRIAAIALGAFLFGGASASVTGYSSSSNGGFTTNGGVCGASKVRLFYSVYSGSPTYYTSWHTSSDTAFVPNPGTIVRGGNHGVDDPAAAFVGAENYSS